MSVIIHGNLVRLELDESGVQNILQPFKNTPDTFAQQFHSSVSEYASVYTSHEQAFTCGLSSYFQVYDNRNNISMGHLRVDWHLHKEFRIGLHGGAPDPTITLREQRLEAWHLLLYTAFTNPLLEQAVTRSLSSNPRATKFITRSGFNIIRNIKMNNDISSEIAYDLRMTRVDIEKQPWYPLIKQYIHIEGNFWDIIHRNPEPYEQSASLPIVTEAQEELTDKTIDISIPPWQCLSQASNNILWMLMENIPYYSAVFDENIPASVTISELQHGVLLNKQNGRFYLCHQHTPHSFDIICIHILSNGSWCQVYGGVEHDVEKLLPIIQFLKTIHITRVEILLSTQLPQMYSHNWVTVGAKIEGISDIDATGTPIQYSYVLFLE